jgi:hypothetical protein
MKICHLFRTLSDDEKSQSFTNMKYCEFTFSNKEIMLTIINYAGVINTIRWEQSNRIQLNQSVYPLQALLYDIQIEKSQTILNVCILSKKETRWQDVGWIYLVRNKEKWWTRDNALISLRVSYIARNFLSI